jgi:hypothetical protein
VPIAQAAAASSRLPDLTRQKSVGAGTVDPGTGRAPVALDGPGDGEQRSDEVGLTATFTVTRWGGTKGGTRPGTTDPPPRRLRAGFELREKGDGAGDRSGADRGPERLVVGRKLR